MIDPYVQRIVEGSDLDLEKATVLWKKFKGTTESFAKDVEKALISLAPLREIFDPTIFLSSKKSSKEFIEDVISGQIDIPKVVIPPKRKDVPADIRAEDLEIDEEPPKIEPEDDPDPMNVNEYVPLSGKNFSKALIQENSPEIPLEEKLRREKEAEEAMQRGEKSKTEIEQSKVDEVYVPFSGGQRTLAKLDMTELANLEKSRTVGGPPSADDFDMPSPEDLGLI